MPAFAILSILRAMRQDAKNWLASLPKSSGQDAFVSDPCWRQIAVIGLSGASSIARTSCGGTALLNACSGFWTIVAVAADDARLILNLDRDHGALGIMLLQIFHQRAKGTAVGGTGRFAVG